MDGAEARSIAGGTTVTAWRPELAGVAEVFHAHFIDHAYPTHTHDAWTLLIVDDGVISYDLDRHEHDVVRATVTLLPPHVPHGGRAATRHGFRKRVIYLDRSSLSEALIGAAVDRPSFRDSVLRRDVDALHRALRHPADVFEAESRLALVRDRLNQRLRRQVDKSRPEPPAGLATQLRELLDARTVSGLTLAEAARLLHAHPTHLVRAFTRRYGLPPHRYLVGRRIDRARQLLLDGQPPADVAASSGFYDQAHLTRHFSRYLGVSPAKYQSGGADQPRTLTLVSVP